MSTHPTKTDRTELAQPLAPDAITIPSLIQAPFLVSSYYAADCQEMQHYAMTRVLSALLPLSVDKLVI
jgi:hypothetical protein